MRAGKKKKLEARGWTVGSAAEFLDLTPEESAFITTKLQLACAVRKRRQYLNLTQSELARRIESSQSRVAKLEAGDPSVALDLVFRALFALGLSRKDLARILEREGLVPA
jgi:ribosome-binding protein aMBF1 (putative translation factor)